MNVLRTVVLLVLSVAAAACGNLNFYTDEQLEEVSKEAYAQATNEHGVVTTGRDADMVQRVAQRIAAASGETKFKWEARLLKADDVPNAFCLPNGRIAIYTGILPITQNEDGLAVVMGHEVAHATLRHGGQRMTNAAISQTGMALLDAGIGGFTQMTPNDRAKAMAAAGMVANVAYILPYSRDHETEADVEGLRFVIRAGYDPYEAPKLWERMAKLGGSGGPAFLSTHPAPLDRAQKLRELIPILLEEEKGQRAASAPPANAARR